MRKVILIILFLCSFGLITTGIIISFNNNSTNKSNDEITDESIGTKLSEDEIAKYDSVLKMNISYFDLFLSKKYPIDDFDKMSDTDKTLFLLNTKVNYMDNEISVSDLEKEKSLYFKDFSLTLEDIKEDEFVLYKYENNKFTYNSSSDSMCSIYSKNVSSTAYKEFWTIENKIYFIGGKSEDGVLLKAIYTNLNDCDNRKN